MTSTTVTSPGQSQESSVAAAMALQFEVEQFLYREARLLDDREFDAWLDLFDDSIQYWMPTRYNRLRREQDREFAARSEVANFDEDKASLRQRVLRLHTGMAWAEDPPSRTRHLVTNVEIRSATDDELSITSAFLTYRNRGDVEWDIWVGKRDDELIRDASGDLLITRRTISLDQATILSKNLSVFF